MAQKNNTSGKARKPQQERSWQKKGQSQASSVMSALRGLMRRGKK